MKYLAGKETKKSNFSIRAENGELLFEYIFDKWYSRSKARTNFDKSDYRIAPESMLSRRTILTRNGFELGKCRFVKHRLMKLYLNNSRQESCMFEMIQPSWRSKKLEVKAESGLIVVEISPKFSWKTFDFNYAIEIKDALEDFNLKEILLICMVGSIRMLRDQA